MKTKIVLLGTLTMIGALGGCWAIAYQQGYTRGARDEFVCWKQVPIKLDAAWDGKLLGRRDPGLLPGGQSFSKWAPVRNEPANNVPAYIFPR